MSRLQRLQQIDPARRDALLATTRKDRETLVWMTLAMVDGLLTGDDQAALAALPSIEPDSGDDLLGLVAAIIVAFHKAAS